MTDKLGLGLALFFIGIALGSLVGGLLGYYSYMNASSSKPQNFTVGKIVRVNFNNQTAYLYTVLWNDTNTSYQYSLIDYYQRFQIGDEVIHSGFNSILLYNITQTGGEK